MKTDDQLSKWRKVNEIELTVKGRNSGKPLPRPVWFAIRGQDLLLLPVTGTDAEWYKNVVRNPQVTISAPGETIKGKLRLITEKNDVKEIIALFEEKYGASDIKKYYPKPNVAASLSLAMRNKP